MPHVEVRLEGRDLVIRAENGDLYPCKNPQELWDSLAWIADGVDESSIPATQEYAPREEREVFEPEIVTDEQLAQERAEREQQERGYQVQNGIPIPDLGDPVSNFAARHAVRGGAATGKFLQNLSFRGRSQRHLARMKNRK